MNTELEDADLELKEAALIHGLSLKLDFKKLTADVRDFSRKRLDDACIRYSEALCKVQDKMVDTDAPTAVGA